jgi:hypothetical protein
MPIGILHADRVSLNEVALVCESFLIVGLIASIRRVLDITLDSSQGERVGMDPGIPQFVQFIIDRTVRAEGPDRATLLSIFLCAGAKGVQRSTKDRFARCCNKQTQASYRWLSII